MITKKKLPQAISAVFSIPTLCLGLALVSTGVQATTWQYVGGNSSYNTQSGQPNTLTDLSRTYPADLLQRVIQRLPEGDIAGYVPVAPALITDDAGANLVLKVPTGGTASTPINVKVSYVFEGAGYQNSVGFFKFTRAGLTTLAKTAVVDTIMFPNFSDNVLQTGKAVDLGNFVADDAIGFTIVANGWKSGVGVNPDKSANNIFRSIKRFNPEPSTSKQGHTVLLADPAHELLILAFEDLHRETSSLNDGGYATDDDFNDVVIAIHVTPFSAVDCTTCIPLVPPTLPPPAATCGLPLTTSPLPAAALTNGGRKVNICHFPPGNTVNQKINISVNALGTHLSHSIDTLQINGVCSATVCPTTPTCTSPQVLKNGACVTPETTCTSPQVLQNGVCVTPAVPVGNNGPISWREITVPAEVTDTLQATKAAAKAAAAAAAAAGTTAP